MWPHNEEETAAPAKHAETRRGVNHRTSGARPRSGRSEREADGGNTSHRSKDSCSRRSLLTQRGSAAPPDVSGLNPVIRAIRGFLVLLRELFHPRSRVA